MLSGCIIYRREQTLLPPGTRKGVLYTYIGVGFRRCSFRLDGQCESLDAWDERQYGSPRFFIVNFFRRGNGKGK